MTEKTQMTLLGGLGALIEYTAIMGGAHEIINNNADDLLTLGMATLVYIGAAAARDVATAYKANMYPYNYQRSSNVRVADLRDK